MNFFIRRLQKYRISEASKTCVLIVEPDRATLEFTDERLANYQVVYADGAEAALTKLRTSRRKIDVVLTEFVLPDMNGMDFIDRVHETRNVPVVFLSAFEGVDVIRECLARGAKFCFTKPILKVNADSVWQFRVTNERFLAENQIPIWDNSHLEDDDGSVDNDVSYLEGSFDNWTESSEDESLDDDEEQIDPNDAQIQQNNQRDGEVLNPHAEIEAAIERARARLEQFRRNRAQFQPWDGEHFAALDGENVMEIGRRAFFLLQHNDPRPDDVPQRLAALDAINERLNAYNERDGEPFHPFVVLNVNNARPDAVLHHYLGNQLQNNQWGGEVIHPVADWNGVLERAGEDFQPVAGQEVNHERAAQVFGPFAVHNVAAPEVFPRIPGLNVDHERVDEVLLPVEGLNADDAGPFGM